ncbi:hypothetical protein CLOM_g3432 [Closterium sp. NIES-68]|nr:hypothetical protein CLOM_g3432 [Closterium sp. NIES-68]
MASWFKITAALVILLVCIPCLLANDSPWTTPPVAEPWGLSQQSPAIPGSQPQVNPTAQSSLDSQPSNQTLSRASPPVPSESFAHSPVESQPPLTQPSVSTAGPPISQPSAEPLAQQPPPLPAPPQVAPAGSGSGTSSGEQNAGSGESKSGAGEALPAPPSPQAAPPPSPVGPEGVSGAPAEPKGGVEAWDEEAGQVELSVTCGLTDYVRQSGSCDGKGWRIVSFVKIRNCTDPFKVQPMRQEPCTCTPEDFDVTYSISDDGTKCNMQYLPANCTGAQQSAFIPVDMVYCGLASAPCTVGDMDAIYSDCDFIRHPLTGQAISDTPVVEVIYYFGRECDPYRRGSIRLPPSTYIPCDMQCGVGHYLRHDHCLKCPAGTYSMGGKWRFEEIYEIDPKYFKTECKFTNATGAFDCDPWYADDGAFEAGAYDYINDWLPEVCASDAAYNCHNNLRSSLSLDVNLVRDGYVKFNFTVSAEMGHDGLSFYIDSLAEPLMALTSYQFEPREMVFPVEAGQHRLVWEYSKDSKWSKGEDVTTIPYIEVDGVAFNDFHCLPCPPGSHSGEGAAACLPCPDNTFSKERASECTPCGSSTYSRIIPRTECKPRPSCSIERDATIAYTPCQLASKKRTMRWQWIQPQICDPTNVSLPNDTPLDCEPCPDGQQAEPDPQSGEIRCTLCPPCEACEAGQVAMKTLSLKHFAMQHNGALPPGFTTGCHGDCGTFGWRAFQDHLDSGSGHGPSATVRGIKDSRTQGLKDMRDPGRAFFFFIDHDLMDYVEQQRVEWEGGGEGEGYEHPGAAEDEARMSGMWELDAGNHTVIGGDSYVPCPPGTSSEGGNSSCLPCPPNTFNSQPEWACMPCGLGTSSLEGSRECVIGDATRPDGAFTDATGDTMAAVIANQSAAAVVFDLSLWDECPQTNMPRETKVTFICDPAAGGTGAHRAERLLVRRGVVLAVCVPAVHGGRLQACGGCCLHGRQEGHLQLCQLNPSHPLPPDEPCEPCQQGEIIRTVGDCADADGRHNVTFAWRQPHHCSATLPGAASLPAAELVGPCEQRLLYVASEALSPMWAALFVALGLCIVCFGSLSLMTWLRSRRLRQMYERLVEAEVQMEREMGDLHGDDDADVDADVEDTRQLTNGDS